MPGTFVFLYMLYKLICDTDVIVVKASFREGVAAGRTLNIFGSLRITKLRVFSCNMSCIGAVRYGEPLIAVTALLRIINRIRGRIGLRGVRLRSIGLLVYGRRIAVTIHVGPGLFLRYMNGVNRCAVTVWSGGNLLIAVRALFGTVASRICLCSGFGLCGSVFCSC